MTTREEFLATLTRSNVEAERSADTSSGRVTFYDADSGAIGEPTYNRSGKLNENFRQAYHDAPETDHNGKGAEIGAYDARDHFLQLLREHPDAHAQSTGSSDYYGRGNVTEFVTPDGTNINTEMIRSGLTIPLGQQTTDTRNAATAATFNTMTDAGDMLTGADAQTNAIARRVQAEASFALDSGLIPNPAFKDGFSPIHTNGIVSDAYNRGVHQTKAMLHAGVAAVADAVGADGLKQRELDAADASQTKAGAFYSRSNTWDDVHNFSDAGTYALEKTVENLPVIGLTAGAALATGGASLTAEGALAAAGARTAASVVSRIGAREGAMAALYGVNTGDTALQLRDEGVKDFGTPSLLVGVPKTMLDYASLASMSRGVKRAVSESFKGKGFDPVSAAHEFIKDVATESGTEGFQQIWDNGAVAATTGKPFNFNNVGESMIAGGTVGFAFGVGHATPGAVRSAIGHITSREPRQDIEAQLQAQREGAKSATFVSQANADSYDSQVEAAGPYATVMRSPEGQLATTLPVSDAERAAYETGTPEERSAINQAHLGYSQDKAQIDLPNSSVVQVTTPEGAVIHEEVTDQPQAVASKLEQTKRPTDVVSVTTPHAAQARRLEAMGHELSVAAAKAHDQVQTLVEQGAPHEQVVEAAKEYEQAAGHLEQVMQLHEQATQDTLTPTATVTGESNGQPTRLADDAGRNVPNASPERDGGVVGASDNGTGSVDSGASQNAPVAGDRAKGPRVDFGRLAPEEQSHIVRRVASEPEFARVIKAYVKQGYSHTAALEFALADEKISASDIPNEHIPSADNTLFDESELPTTDAIVSPDDTDAPENIQNFAKGAYYGPLMVAHQEAFTARHPTWELVPRPASNKDFFLDPKPRVFADLASAEAEAQRLEPLYYGYMFKPVPHDGVYTLSRHKVNGALSTSAVSLTRSWVHQTLPKIKLQARGAESAIRRHIKTMDTLAKNVSNHSSPFYRKRTAQLRQLIQDNTDKLVKVRDPQGNIIELHAPTITEQGKLLLGQYGTHTTRAQYEFLAFKQGLSALAAAGYTYDPRQGPTPEFFPPELNISPSHTPLRVKEVVDPQTAIGVYEEALRVATDELYRLEGLLKAARENQVKTGKQGLMQGKFLAKVEAQRKLVEDLRLQRDGFKSADPTGSDPYTADELARARDTNLVDVSDGRAEVDKMMDNANAAVERSARTEATGFASDAGDFFRPENKGTASVSFTQRENLPAADSRVVESAKAELTKYGINSKLSGPSNTQYATIKDAYSRIAGFFRDVSDVPVLTEYSENEGTYFRRARAVSLHVRSIANAAKPLRKNPDFDSLVFALAHELSHAKDHANGDISYESGEFVDGGSVHDEAVGMLSHSDPKVSEWLNYPFMHVEDIYRPRELFAQLSAAYVTEPELLHEKLPTAYNYFQAFHTKYREGSGSGIALRHAQRSGVEGTRNPHDGSAVEARSLLERPAHLKSVRVVPTPEELREKFRGLTPARVNRWVQTLKDASSPFANLVLTGYTQLKAVHAATADRFKTYIAHKNQMGAYWLSVWHNQIGLDTKRTAAAFDELRAHGEDANITKDMVSADAWALRTFLDEIHKSMLKRYSPTIGKIPNYLPQPVDTRAMISDKEGFLSVLMRYSVDVNKSSTPMDRTTAENIFDSLLGNSTLDGLTIDEVAGAVGPGNKHRYQRVLRNPALIAALDSNGFLFSDKREAMEYYITQGVNRSAFERTFGGYRPVVAMLDQNGAINKSVLADKIRQADIGYLLNSGRLPHELLNDVISMGYARMVNNHVHWYSPVSKLHDARESLKSDATQLRKFDDLIHGMLGFFGDRIGAETKKWQSRIMAGESLLTLAFSTLSSQTDWAGPALRIMQDKGVAAAWRELLAGIRSFSNAKEADSFARAFGFIVPRQHQSAIRAMSGADHMSAGAQKTLDMLFHYNGQEWFTNMTRSFAASTGIHYFKTLAEAQDDVLQSYGIDYEIINRWVKAGEHAPTQEMENSDKAAFDDAMAVHTALHKFVNESIMRPDATQRPNWANDPRFALLWHLKSFFWAFWSTIMEPTFKSAFTQMKNGNHGEAAAQLAFTGLLLLPLAAVGWEIKQVIQYSLFGEDQPSDDMDGVQYTLQLISRADVFGPAQLAFDALGTDGADKAAARLAGPAADHLFTLLHAETDKKIYRSIPVLSQLYGAQRVISD